MKEKEVPTIVVSTTSAVVDSGSDTEVSDNDLPEMLNTSHGDDASDDMQFELELGGLTCVICK